MFYKKYIFKISFIMLLIFVVLVAKNVMAIDSPILSVQPAKVSVKANSGEKVLETLLVVNKSNVPATLRVSVSDYKIVDENGKIEFYLANANSATKWLIPQYLTIELKPLDTQKIQFLAVADKDMPGAGYNGAIIFQLIVNGKPVGKSFGTLVDFNVLSKGITTGGTISGFSMPMFQFADPTKLGFKLKNSSNSNLSASGDIILTNVLGKIVRRFNAGQLDLAPGATRNFQFQWSSSPLFGIYKANIDLVNLMRSDNKFQSSAWLVFLPLNKIIPLVLIILVLAIIISIFLFVFMRSRKIKKKLFMQNDLLQN